MHQDKKYKEPVEESSKEKEETKINERESGRRKQLFTKDDILHGRITDRKIDNHLCIESTLNLDKEKVSRVMRTSGLRSETPTVHHVKMNEKFEVPIIEEDGQKKMFKNPNVLFESCTIDETSVFEKQRNEHSLLDEYATNGEAEFKNFGRRVSFAEPHFFEIDSMSDDGYPKESNTINNEQGNKDSTYETSNDDAMKIYFKHSVRCSSLVYATRTKIISPADVYNIFCRPKSILKTPLTNASFSADGTKTNSATRSSHNLVSAYKITHIHAQLSARGPIARF